MADLNSGGKAFAVSASSSSVVGGSVFNTVQMYFQNIQQLSGNNSESASRRLYNVAQRHPKIGLSLLCEVHHTVDALKRTINARDVMSASPHPIPTTRIPRPSDREYTDENKLVEEYLESIKYVNPVSFLKAIKKKGKEHIKREEDVKGYGIVGGGWGGYWKILDLSVGGKCENLRGILRGCLLADKADGPLLYMAHLPSDGGHLVEMSRLVNEIKNDSRGRSWIFVGDMNNEISRVRANLKEANVTILGDAPTHGFNSTPRCLDYIIYNGQNLTVSYELKENTDHDGEQFSDHAGILMTINWVSDRKMPEKWSDEPRQDEFLDSDGELNPIVYLLNEDKALEIGIRVFDEDEDEELDDGKDYYDEDGNDEDGNDEDGNDEDGNDEDGNDEDESGKAAGQMSDVGETEEADEDGNDEEEVGEENSDEDESGKAAGQMSDVGETEEADEDGSDEEEFE